MVIALGRHHDFQRTRRGGMPREIQLPFQQLMSFDMLPVVHRMEKLTPSDAS